MNQQKFSSEDNKRESLKTHYLSPVLFVFIYIIFNATYTFLGGTYSMSQEIEEAGLYSLLDWQHNPLKAALYSTVGVAALVGVTALTSFFTSLLLNAFYHPQSDSHTAAPISTGKSPAQFLPPVERRDSSISGIQSHHQQIVSEFDNSILR